ncbi:ion transporter [Rhodovulum sp. DZ06]|uniref:ion transporter n=1 Tax=Rhodovulum sp. DZ06 TaxID=3425126 RepID=UPI003D33BA61
MTFRRRVWTQLDLDAWTGGGVSPVNRLILVLVLASVTVSVLETEPTLAAWSPLFRSFNLVFAVAFSAEFAARLWAKPENPLYADPGGRMRYFLAWHSLVDLVAVASLWLDVFGMGEGWIAVLRLARLFRIFWLTRSSSVGEAVRELWSAVRERSTELFLAAVLAGLVLILAAIALYIVEAEAQPEAFGSIPRAMWWAIATLTTVGYGDVYPVTWMGKIIAGFAALTSIAIVALPAGILAAAFSDAFQKTRARRKAKGPDA